MKIAKPSHVWQLAFEGDWPTSVAFLPDGKRIAAGNRAGQIYVWQLPDSAPDTKSETPPSIAPFRALEGHTNGITHLLSAPNGTLISSSLDRTIRIWDVNGPLTGKREVVLDAKLRADSARNKPAKEKDAILNAPGADVESVAAMHTLEGHTDWIKALDISANGQRLISGDDDCLTIVWDLADQTKVASWHGYARVWVSSAALSPDGKTAFTAEYAGRRSSFDVPAAQARLWDASTGKQRMDLLKVWTPKTKDEDRVDSYGYGRVWGELMKRGLICAAISPDGKLIAAGQGGETESGKIHLIDVESGKILRTVSGHRSGACAVKFSADGKYVLSSGRDTVVRICQVSDGKEVATLGKSRGGQFKDWMHAISISPDQQLVAAADIAGYVHIWKLAP
ncbi:MAG: hypothetical protein O3A00_20650 [Planctomycetota bacterium]|nr:hypothetical protein [Planctomycetota bacterium]